MNLDISNILAEIESKKSELDSEKEKFIQACKSFARDAINKRVRHAISANSEKVKKLGASGLAPIKNEVAESLSNIDSFVEEIICNDSYWLYTKDEITTESCPYSSYAVHGNRLPEIIDEPVRMLLSPAGVILISNGLESSEQWEKRGEMMRYRYGFDLNNNLKEIMTSFNSTFNELFRLLEKLEAAKSKKDSSEALNLWDSV